MVLMLNDDDIEMDVVYEIMRKENIKDDDKNDNENEKDDDD